MQLEKRYEDKLALLLMQRTGGAAAAAATAAPTNGTGAEGEEVEEEAGTGAVHEEAIRRIEQLRDELELYKRSAQMLREQLDEATKRPVRKRRMPNHLLDPDFNTEFDLEFLEDEYNQVGGTDDDNPELDPDFRGTPLHKRKKVSPSNPSVNASVNDRLHGLNNPNTPIVVSNLVWTARK